MSATSCHDIRRSGRRTSGLLGTCASIIREGRHSGARECRVKPDEAGVVELPRLVRGASVPAPHMGKGIESSGFSCRSCGAREVRLILSLGTTPLANAL